MFMEFDDTKSATTACLLRIDRQFVNPKLIGPGLSATSPDSNNKVKSFEQLAMVGKDKGLYLDSVWL